ncbi:dTDP-4-dehydrorhamnose reductase [Rubritalea tangerina]|uniref:dTDP-4-dehydrorhamnose reductase n=1 Tax=Rubritalea tangerina TaxID=430798 RepID=A0ABW4ZCD0_9BACT
MSEPQVKKATKVLVVGQTGQLAKALADAVPLRESIEMTVLGRPDIDLTNPGLVREVLKRVRPDVVVNASAYTAVDKAETDHELAYQVNAQGVEVLAKACADGGAQFIHVSTDYVFDGSGTEPYKPEDMVSPLGAYGASKLKGEELALAALASSVIIRTSWVYGDEGSNFVSTMLRLAESRDELGIVADQLGRPTYASDLAGAILDIVPALDGSQGGVYHYSNEGEVTSWHGFAEAIFRTSEEYGARVPDTVRAITTAEYPTPAKRPAWSVLDLEKIKNVFSISIPDWNDSLATYFKKKETK